MIGLSIADLSQGAPDRAGATVRALYALKPPEYAVYATDARVRIQFADDSATANAQRASLVRLNPLRGEINGLLDSWDGDERARAFRYDRRVADALSVALEGDMADAELLLRAVKQDALDERSATARFEYLATALGVGAVGMAIIALCTYLLDWGIHGTELARAAATGAIGAFFSISLAIRGRTVLPDLQRTANQLDAGLRMIIGVIAAGTLMAFIASGFVTINMGNAAATGPADSRWLLPLIYGFIAGFSERFVPDLLAKATASTDGQRAPLAAPIGPPAVVPAADGAEAVAALASGAAIVPDPAADQSGIEGCVCDIELTDAELTDDADLPPATGGVAAADIVTRAA